MGVFDKARSVIKKKAMAAERKEAERLRKRRRQKKAAKETASDVKKIASASRPGRAAKGLSKGSKASLRAAKKTADAADRVASESGFRLPDASEFEGGSIDPLAGERSTKKQTSGSIDPLSDGPLD